MFLEFQKNSPIHLFFQHFFKRSGQVVRAARWFAQRWPRVLPALVLIGRFFGSQNMERILHHFIRSCLYCIASIDIDRYICVLYDISVFFKYVFRRVLRWFTFIYNDLQCKQQDPHEQLLSNQYDMGWWPTILRIFFRGWLNHQQPVCGYIPILPAFLCWFPILQFFRWCKPWRATKVLCWRSRPMSQPGPVSIEPRNQKWDVWLGISLWQDGPPRYGPWLTMKWLHSVATFRRQLNVIEWGPHPVSMDVCLENERSGRCSSVTFEWRVLKCTESPSFPAKTSRSQPGFRNSWCATGRGPEPNGSGADGFPPPKVMQGMVKVRRPARRVSHLHESGHSCSAEIMRQLDHFEGTEYLEFRLIRSIVI